MASVKLYIPIRVVFDPAPPEPQEPEHIPGLWAWLTGKNEKLFNEHLEEYHAWVREYVLWLERNQTRETED